MSAALRPGYRAVTLRIGSITGTGGFILPGSYVDIILTQSVRLRSGPTRKFTVAETLFRKVRVVAVDRVINDIKRAARKSRTATVEVKLKDAKKLIVARRLGSLTLMVRSAADDPEAERGPNLIDTNDVSIFSRGRVSSRTLVLVTTKAITTGTLLTDQDFEWRLMPAGTNLDGLIQPMTILSNPLAPRADRRCQRDRSRAHP